jgi:protein YibB
MPDTSISIVTAFFDLGRGDWTTQSGFSAGYQRSTDVYLQRFETMARLDNHMVVYTSPDLAPAVLERRRGKEDRTRVIPLPFASLFPDKRAAIRRVQEDPAFRARLNPVQHNNPERRSPDYILVTNLKPFFVTHAVQNRLVADEQVAWMDFGYCTSIEDLAGSHAWQYAFPRDKIHLFAFSHYHGEISIGDIVANNVAYIVGGCVVAERRLWPLLAQLTRRAEQELLAHTMVDNDQTLFLLASLYQPSLFDVHLVPNEGWRLPLRLFNINAITGEDVAEKEKAIS